MAIYNLGTLEQPRSEVNPYMENLMKFGMQTVLNEQQIAGQKEIAKESALTSAKELVARSELERASKNAQNFTATWQALSDKPQDKRDLFLQTDSGKEYLKVAKKYIPEVFDTDGKPIFFPSTENQIKQELDAQIAATKLKLAKDPNSLTPGESKLLSMEGYKDDIAEVTADLYKTPEFISLMADPGSRYNPRDPKDTRTSGEVAQAMAQAALNQRISMRKGLQTGGGNPLTPNLSGQEEPVANLAKPGSARFRVTPIK